MVFSTNADMHFPDNPSEPTADNRSIPHARPGDVWQLGRHRVACGDVRDGGLMKRLRGRRLAAMVFTDPPYNVGYEGKTAKRLTIANDSMGEGDFRLFIRDALTALLNATVKGGALYLCHADAGGHHFRPAMIEAGWRFSQCLIWVKHRLVLGWQDYHWRHEPILYGWRPGAAHRWYGGRKNTTVLESEPGVDVSIVPDGVVITLNTGVRSIAVKAPTCELLDDGTIWRVPSPQRNAEHPTMKPIGLVCRAINNSSRKGDLVLDGFLGSGTTLLAAETTGRTCYGVEIDPQFVDVVIDRWQTMTGETATLKPLED